MKKIIILPLTFFAVTLLWILARMPVDHLVVEEVQKVVTPKVKPLPLPAAEVDALREPSSDDKKVVKKDAPKINFEKPAREASQEEWKDFKGLPEDLKLATNLYSMSAREFSPNMGEVVNSDDKTVTFHADIRPTQANFMAIDPANNKAYPIAPSVRVANVSEQLRSALINEGLIEKYYNEELKVMFVEATEKNVLQVFKELTGLKLDAELEVIRGYNQLR